MNSNNCVCCVDNDLLLHMLMSIFPVFGFVIEIDKFLRYILYSAEFLALFLYNMMGSKDSQLKSLILLKPSADTNLSNEKRNLLFFLSDNRTINKASPETQLCLPISPDDIFNKLKELNMKMLSCHVNLIYNYL